MGNSPSELVRLSSGAESAFCSTLNSISLHFRWENVSFRFAGTFYIRVFFFLYVVVPFAMCTQRRIKTRLDLCSFESSRHCWLSSLTPTTCIAPHPTFLLLLLFSLPSVNCIIYICGELCTAQQQNDTHTQMKMKFLLVQKLGTAHRFHHSEANTRIMLTIKKKQMGICEYQPTISARRVQCAMSM